MSDKFFKTSSVSEKTSEFCSHFEQKIIGRFVETVFYVSGETFWVNQNFEMKFISL